MDAADTVKALETLANVPVRYLIGSTTSRIVYLSNDGGTHTLWSLDPASGSSSKVTEGPVGTAGEVATPRNVTDTVFYAKDTAKGRELHLLYRADAVRREESLAADMQPMRIAGIAMSGETAAFTAATRDELAVYVAESGRLEKKAKFDSMAFVTDISGDYIVGSGILAENPRSQELFVINVGSGEFKVVTPRAGSVNKAPFLNGSRLLFESDYTGKNTLHFHDLETGETSPASFGHPDLPSYGAVEHQYYGWTADGKVWAIGKKDGESKAFLDGKEIPTPRGFLWGLAVHGGRAYVAHTSLAQPIRILEVGPKRGQSRVVLDNPLPEDIKRRLHDGRMVRFKSFDGREIPALVVEDGTGVPKRTVTLVHGGPWSEYLNSWAVLMNALVLAGYNVVAPNYRGSTGYGEEFRKLDIGDPGGGDLRDIAAAARWALANRLASEVAIAGYSYGGYSSLLALGREPELWACGVAGAPMADWRRAHELADAVYKQFVETLFDHKMELLGERSPITYVKNVRRPVCILTSVNDSRTPMLPVLEYAKNLLEQGAVFEMHAIPDMGHLLTTTQDAMDIVLPAIAFLHRRFPPTRSSS